MWKRFALLEDNLLKYGVAALLIVIPLYPKFPLFWIPGSSVAVRAEDFLIAAFVGIWLLKEARSRFIFLRDNLNRTLLAYFVIGFLSLASAILVTHSVVPYIGLLHAFRRVEYMVVLFIIAASIKTRKELIFYLEVIFLTLFLVFLYGVGQKFFLLPVISTMNIEFAKGFALRLHPGARVSSTFAGHYDLAAYLVLLLPLVMVVLVAVKRKLLKILLGFLFLIAFWLLLVSASRISFFAYLLGITFTLWFVRRRIWIVPVLIFSVGASLLTPQLTDRYSQTVQVALYKVKQVKFTLPWEKQPTVISFVPEPTPTPTPAPPAGKAPPVAKKIRIIPTPTPTPSEKRIVFYGAADEIPQTEDRSLSIRVNVEWPRAIRAWLKNPLLGTGFSSITLATDNDYLRSLGEVGLLGFLAFALILIILAGRSLRFLFQKTPRFENFLLVGLLGAMIGFLANAFFIDVFEASKVAVTFWLLMGIMVATTRILQKETR